MANRRLGDFAQTYLRYMLQQKLADAQAESVYRRQEANNASQDSRQLRQMALADPTGRVANLTGQNEFIPSGEAMFQDLGKSIMDTKSMGDLPTAPDIRGQAAKKLRMAGRDPALNDAGAMPMKSQGVAFADSGPDGKAMFGSSLVPAERPDIASLIAQRDTKQNAIMQADEYTTDLGAARAEMNARAGEIGQNKGQQETFGDVRGRTNTLAADALGNELNKRRAIDPLDIRRAGSIAGAQESAQINTRHGNMDKLSEISRAMSPQNPTQGERSAAGQLTQLAQAHAAMTQLEDKGVGLRGNIQTILEYPMLANSPIASYYSDDEKLYAQSGGVWGNIQGYIMSGVAVRPDERAKFVSTMVTNQGDPEVLKKKKQSYRQAMLQAAQISAGRAAGDGGVALGRAVQAGALPAEIVRMFQMDPEVQAGFEAGLAGQ